jgi:predicted nucleic acid-binding protein
MAKLVIDASLAAAWCFPDERTDYTNEVLLVVGSTIDPIAPSLWAYEIRNTVLMGIRRGRITGESAKKLLGLLEGLKVQLVDPPSHDRIFELAGAPRADFLRCRLSGPGHPRRFRARQSGRCLAQGGREGRCGFVRASKKRLDSGSRPQGSPPIRQRHAQRRPADGQQDAFGEQ